MGPLLPILILLFWQSPSTFERLAFEGRFPSTQLVYATTETWVGERPAVESADVREYSRAVVRVLHSARTEEVQPEIIVNSELVVPQDDSSAKVQPGFATSQRSRDGPR